MKCPNCGEEISDFDIVCPNCETDFQNEVAENTETQQNNLKLCIISFVLCAFIALFTNHIMFEIAHTGLNRTANCFIYTAAIVYSLFITFKYGVRLDISKRTYLMIFLFISAIINFIVGFINGKADYSRIVNGMQHAILFSQETDIIKAIYYLSNILSVVVTSFACFFLSVIICNMIKHK